MYAITKECLEKGDIPRFKGLTEIASSDVVIVSAIHKIKANRGSKTAGTDGQTINDILTQNYNAVINFVKRSFKKYKPKPIRRVFIPKPGKKEKRPLGIPTIADRIIQECVRMTIEPILEAQFFQHSYGFRPYRDTKHAIERCVFICNRIGYNWVIEGDIKGFFDNVDHTILIKQLWHMGIRDRRMLMIIKAMLKAGVMKETKVNEMGTPQGGILSPLLANVYLHKLDQLITREWEEKRMRNGTTIRTAKFNSLRNYSTITRPEFYVRYADDWVLFT
ncbi:MAG: reverse transcriptase domain-containing protein, partial [Caldibacillus thermoamylovorans]